MTASASGHPAPGRSTNVKAGIIVGSPCRPWHGHPLTLEQSTVSSTPPHRCTVLRMQRSINQRTMRAG